MRRQGDGLRIEGPGDSTMIENSGTAILLYRRTKLVAMGPTATEVSKNPVPNPIERLRQAKSADATFVGKELIDGYYTSKFKMPVKDVSVFQDAKQYGFGAKFEMTVWIDVETKLPVRIEIRHPKNSARIVFESLKWNEALDESLFDTTIPPGFAKTTESP